MRTPRSFSPTKTTGALPIEPWALTEEEVLRQLGVELSEGLSPSAVIERRARHGANLLHQSAPRRWWAIFCDQWKSIIVLLLAMAVTLSFFFGEYVEATAITAVILINALLGFFMELRAVQSMEALRKLGQVTTKVRRDGQLAMFGAEELVPGDIVVLEGGDVVSADIRIITSSKLEADESLLTGESTPVSKKQGILPTAVEISERSNMLMKGSAVTRGSAEGVVVATGMATQLGEITSLVAEAEEEITPLEKRLNILGHKLVWVTVGIVLITAAVGILSGKEVFLMVKTAIALAVAAIPEGLPIVATIALARGVWRMARHRALVKRLSSVETLGATSVIFTDKTGTLTENQLTVERYHLPCGDIALSSSEGRFTEEEVGILQRALEIGVLCNNAQWRGDGQKEIGDPLEVALLRAGCHLGDDIVDLLDSHPRVREVAFDSESKMMATYHRTDEGVRIAVKGAAENVIAACTALAREEGSRPLDEGDVAQWLQWNETMALDGLRVLALAEKRGGDEEQDPYDNLTLVALVGFSDPARSPVAPAIDRCRQAGIDVIMVTGDQSATALNIGRQVGLIAGGESADVILGHELRESSPEHETRLARTKLFARVNPRDKLELIAYHQSLGKVVAMTGDGVNDAPALKKADIGVAMGKNGTEVAREASDMVLLDDHFETIVKAVELGRVIFDNIRKFVLYLLSCNLSEILIVGIAAAMRAPLPILPLQILFLNMVTDVFPALALGMGKGGSEVMQRAPRPFAEAIVGRPQWRAIGIYSALITLAVLSGFFIAWKAWEFEPEQAVSVSFLILALAQLGHVFNMRNRESSPWSNDIVRNPFVWGAIVICLALLGAAVFFAPLCAVLQLSPLPIKGWALVAVLSSAPLILGQVGHRWIHRA